MHVLRSFCLLIVLSVATTIATTAAAQQETSEPIRPALLVMDIQNVYLPMMDQSDHDMMMRVIKACIQQFRSYDLPVICIYHTDPQWGPEPGTEDFEFPDSINIVEDDPKIVKSLPSAFAKTELEKVLSELKVDTVFITGISATGCALATYFGAAEYGLDAFMVESGISSANAAHTDAVTEFTQSVGWGALNAILRGVATD